VAYFPSCKVRSRAVYQVKKKINAQRKLSLFLGDWSTLFQTAAIENLETP
jgi:hypothetical protein